MSARRFLGRVLDLFERGVDDADRTVRLGFLLVLLAACITLIALAMR